MEVNDVKIEALVRKLRMNIMKVFIVCLVHLLLTVNTQLAAEAASVSRVLSQQIPASSAGEAGYLLNPGACPDGTFLVILVSSGPDHFDQRSAIRDTWGSTTTYYNTLLLFMVGIPPNVTSSFTKSLHQEFHNHHDIVQDSFIDTYHNLSLKSIAILRWVKHYCPNTKFVLKTDDDMYINIPLLLKDLHNSVHEHFIMGHIIAGASPSRDSTSKWYTPSSVYPDNHYPTYVSGTAYVISGDLVSDLHDAAGSVNAFWIEDVFITGICADKVKAKLIFNSKFGYKKRPLSPCLFRIVITAHRMKTAELRRVWQEVSRTDVSCDYAHIHMNILT